MPVNVPGVGVEADGPPQSGADDLVARLKAGDREAFREAVTRFSPRMLATATAIVGATHAEDVVQESWLTVFEKIGGFQERSALGTWLVRIVTNRAISRRRSHGREVSASEFEGNTPEQEWFDQAGRWVAPPSAWSSGSPEELLDAGRLQECIDKHLALMPENQRAVVVLRDMQQLAFDEICNELDLSASNARVLLHRGRMKLMKMVNGYQEHGSC